MVSGPEVYGISTSVFVVYLEKHAYLGDLPEPLFNVTFPVPEKEVPKSGNLGTNAR